MVSGRTAYNSTGRNFPRINVYVVLHKCALTRLLVQNLERLNHLMGYALNHAHARLRLLLEMTQIERHVAVLVANLSKRNSIESKQKKMLVMCSHSCKSKSGHFFRVTQIS